MRRSSSRSLRLFRWAFIAVLGGAIALSAGSAGASLTTPTSGSTVRGDVLITENQGGRNDLGCSSSGVDGIITVYSGATVVYTSNKGSGGSYSKTWVSHGLARGTYRILSQSKDRFLGGFCSLATNTKSDFNVTLDNLSATTYSGATSAYYTENFTATATLKDSISSRVIVGGLLNFSLAGGASTGSCTTNASGVCSVTLNANVLPGTHTLSTSYAETGNWRASTANTTFTVLKRPTTLVYGGDTIGTYDEDIDVSADLGDTRLGNAPLAGKVVSFNLKSGATVLQTVTAGTDVDGLAATTMHLNVGGGTYTIEASFAGDAIYSSSASSSPFTVLKRATMLGYNGDTDGYWTEDATASGTLLDAVTGDPIIGGARAFGIGTGTAGGSTDALGFAAGTIGLNDAPGSYTASASFAGDAFFLPSDSATGFTIKKRPSALVYDGAVTGPHNGTAILSATLTDVRNGSGVSGKNVHFALGSFEADATTNASGAASVVAPMDQDAGSYTVTATYDEDGFYLGSGDSVGFAIGWEFTFGDDDGNGTVFINTSNKQFAFVSGDSAFDTGVVDDPDMQITSVPDGATPPDAPEVPECTDDPTGGDPVCPADYLPPPPAAAMTAGEECIEDPLGGDPVCTPPVEEPTPPCDVENAESCVPPVEEPTPPCDVENAESCVPPVEEPTHPCPNDPQGCIPQPVPSACELPYTAGCHERFVSIAYSNETFSLTGVFDLDTGSFAATVTTASATYVVRHGEVPEVPEPPSAPCDTENPESCVPDVEPPAAPCDTENPESCVPDVQPPAAPCDPESPEGCVPETPPAPEPPSCVENPLGDPICP